MTQRSLVGALSILIIVTFLAIESGAAGAATTVTAPVNVTHDKYADNEESLGMSPSGSLLASSWNDWDYNDGCGFSYSTTGGASWAPHTFVPGLTQFTNDPNVPGTGKFEVAGDPSVAYNPRFGVFDVVCQAFDFTPPYPIQLLSTTFDPAAANPNANENLSYGAAAWTDPVAVATGHSPGTLKGSSGQVPDHESITVDTGTGPGHHYGRIYVVWAQFNGFGRSPIELAYSDDNGASWTGPITVSDRTHQFDQDGRIDIAPDGTLYATWSNSPTETSLVNNKAMIAVSHDGGNTWSGSYTAAAIVDPVPGVLPNSNYRAFTDVTSAVDQATGRVVVVFNDERSGASNMWSTHNVGGSVANWSNPLRVKSSTHQQFFPWMSAAPNGRLDLAYYDRSCDASDTRNCVTLSSTDDGGGTWANTALTTQGFDGDKFQACLAFVDPVNCGVFFLGDYIAVGSTNSKAQVLYTGNGATSQDVFSIQAGF
ncbi:MAG: glycoside hydrolase [Actinomycetota bacterium]|nr:glycoside hydrolase [Actinomycetota bacterium]